MATKILVALLAVGISWASTALGQGSGRGSGGRHGSSDSGKESSKVDSDHNAAPAPQIVLTPHGGQCLATEANFIEIVYMPLQIRVYLFDKDLNPLGIGGLRAKMSMQLPNGNPTGPIPFQPAALPPGVTGQDYLATSFDLSPLDRETAISFELFDLPDRKGTSVVFTPLFARSKIRPYVVQVLATEAVDLEGVRRQQICRVSGDRLGSKGPVVKVLIGDFPLYLCCEKCIDAVRQSPDCYLPQTAATPVMNR
jgi:hypothetical protein